MEESRSIIAMKGHPFTRKTEFAREIAAYLGCPMLSYEDFLIELHPPLSPERDKEVFRTICRMAYNQFEDRTFRVVVIDSPLSSAWQLEQITEMAASDVFLEVRVIIIECKPKNAYSWKLKFEEHMRWLRPSKFKRIPWFEPKKWEDVEKAIQINPANYDEKSVRGHERVSKLVVDPVYLSSFDKRIGEAVEHMMTRREEDDSDLLFPQWKQLEFSTYAFLDCSQYGHKIVSKSTAEEGLPVDCVFCEKQVMMSDDDDAYYYYYCKGCSLTLHKDCAESSSPKRMEDMNYACRTCKGNGEGFSASCGTCVVETQLCNRKRPTVISHVDTEEHLLTEVLSNKILDWNYCVVCGEVSSHRTRYLCSTCGLGYHYRCATLPSQVEHEHGLHHHHLLLKYTSEEAEDYLCNECDEFRDPTLWFYSCQDCPYELHPSCVDRQTRVYISDSD